MAAGAGDPLRPAPGNRLRHLTDRRLTRQQRWRLLGAIAAVVLIGTTARALWAAESARAAWSSTTGVVVATRDLPVGLVLELPDLRVVSLPDAAVPPGAVVGDPGNLVGTTVTRPILAGEPIAAARLGASGLGPTAALLPRGWRAVTLPLGTAPPPLTVGDRVELVGVAGGPGSGAPARVVSRTAEVLVVEREALTVAVPAGDVNDVVGAVATGLVTAVLVGT